MLVFGGVFLEVKEAYPHHVGEIDSNDSWW